MKYILAIDQGTSGSKAIIFSQTGEIIASSTTALTSLFLDFGFVEQKPEDIISTVLDATKNTVAVFISKGFDITDIIGAGISNQRESFLLWNKDGIPLTNVVVWQCKRSVQICTSMKNQGLEQSIIDASGLLLDPYFSGTKVKWLIENNPTISEYVSQGKAYFGTIDTWLLYNLTNKQAYKTDYTNASRTLFFNLDNLAWDAQLLSLFEAKNLNLPELCPSSNFFGSSNFGGIFPKEIPIRSMIGDSHAASFGEGCTKKGTVKATMGTGSSVLMNTGKNRIRSGQGMVSTICWSTPDRIDYALEGVIVSCGSTITWLQNNLGLISSNKNFDELAESVESSQGVVFLPAFSGLGGPHWQMERKAEIRGITFGTTAAHIIRAALESYPFQLKDVISAMEQDIESKILWIKADGGLTNSKLTMKYIANLLETKVIIDDRKEASAYGAALLAFLQNNTLTFEQIEDMINKSSHKSFSPAQNIKEQVYIKLGHKQWLEIVNKK